jgi:hypothetical protein
MFYFILLFCFLLWLGNHFIDPMFGYGIGLIAAAVVALWFAWLGLVKPLFFPPRR